MDSGAADAAVRGAACVQGAAAGSVAPLPPPLTARTRTPERCRPSTRLSTAVLESAVARMGLRPERSHALTSAHAVVVLPEPGGPGHRPPEWERAGGAPPPIVDPAHLHERQAPREACDDGAPLRGVEAGYARGQGVARAGRAGGTASRSAQPGPRTGPPRRALSPAQSRMLRISGLTCSPPALAISRRASNSRRGGGGVKHTPAPARAPLARPSPGGGRAHLPRRGCVRGASLSTRTDALPPSSPATFDLLRAPRQQPHGEDRQQR